MKRFLPLLLCLLLLCACVPTPEDEYIVNKGDNATEQQIRGSEAADAREEHLSRDAVRLMV